MLRGIDEKLYMCYIALLTICNESRLSSIFMRRWGRREHFKTHKLGLLLKKSDPILYDEMYNYFNCKYGDYRCLGKKMYAYMYSRFKSLGLDIDNVKTLGDLCELGRRLESFLNGEGSGENNRENH